MANASCTKSRLRLSPGPSAAGVGEIARRIEQESDGALRFTLASLYPLLYRMETRGWTKATWETTPAGVRTGALRSGCTEAEAVACAMERVPDWRALAVAVEKSTEEDAIMTRQALTVLLPGTAMLLAEATGISLVLYSTPADRWFDPRWYVHALAAGLAFLFYLALGAVGAAWSRHLGGSPGERLAAGAFSLVLHVAMAGPAIGADMLYALSRGGAGMDVNIINMTLVMLVVPGAALLLGVLPFARTSARLGAQ